jgi:hypothetical protein
VDETRARFSRTPRGGTADLRSPLGASFNGGPFDEYAHTVDMRRHKGKDGHYNLRKLNFHLYRLRTYEVSRTDAYMLDDGGLRTWTFDPSGRDVPLFMTGRDRVDLADPSRDTSSCAPPAPWEVPDRMTCLLFNHAEYRLDPGEVETFLLNHPSGAAVGAIRSLAGLTFPSRADLLAWLAQRVSLTPEPSWLLPLLDAAITQASAKRSLYGDRGNELRDDDDGDVLIGLGGTEPPPGLPRERVLACDLSSRAQHPVPRFAGTQVLFDPALGRLARAPTNEVPYPLALHYVYAFAADIGAGTYRGRSTLFDEQPFQHGGPVAPSGARGLATFGDDRRYELEPRGLRVLTDYTAQALDGRRPYVRLADAQTGTRLAPAPRTDATGPRRLVVDGLWFGSSFALEGYTITLERSSGDAGDEFDWDEIVVRNATLDPGGTRADGAPIAALRVRVAARVKCLVIDRSIVAAIEVVKSAEPALSGLVETLVIRDSIVDASHTGLVAVDNQAGTTKIMRSTLVGDVIVERLFASELLVHGGVQVADNQSGCFRFSAASPSLRSVDALESKGERNPASRFPPRYHALPSSDQPGFRVEPHYFNSLRFGDPDYLQLSESCPLGVREGGEDQREMGAFARERARIKLHSVEAKVDEYKPVGLIAQYLFET